MEDEMNESIAPLRDADWVAHILGVDRKRVYELAREQVLPCVRLGKRQMRFREADVAALIERGGVARAEQDQELGVVPLRPRA
jgi:excisionase family DNA binding protein